MSRIQRALAQSIVGGALAALPTIALDDWRPAAYIALGAIASTAMAWAQNSLEDSGRIKVRRK